MVSALSFSKYEFLSQWKYWLSGLAVLVLIPLLLNSHRRSRALPPGPRGLPILGNALQVPTQMPWFRFTEWAQEFGPIFSLNVVGQTFIVLNTFKVAGDLLDRRSNIYSDRPRLVMVDEILMGGVGLPFAKYGNTWRKLRRAAHEGLSFRAAEKYKPAQAREAAFAAIQMLKMPGDWHNHLKRATAGSVLTAVYGWPPINDNDEPVIKKIYAVAAKITESSTPGGFLVNTFPILKHTPIWMAKWKREGLEWHRRETQMFDSFNKEVEEKMRSGNSPHCFVSGLIENKDRHELTDKEAAWLAGILFAAGAETVSDSLRRLLVQASGVNKQGKTSTSLAYFILAMLLYPEVMHKAQAELDDVIGRERIPTFGDQKNLPYIEAIVKEVLRWRPVAPMAVPRKVMEDNWYEGHYIPKGAIVIPNVWAMHRNQQIFPDFDDFRPDRFFERTPEDTHSTGHASFGFGKRICVGLNLANQMLFITIATILWALNIDKAKDSNGNLIIPSKHDFIDNGIVVAPASFKCKFSQRFPDVMSILQSEMPGEEVGNVNDFIRE